MVLDHARGGGEGEQVVDRGRDLEGTLVAMAHDAAQPFRIGGAPAHDAADLLLEGAHAWVLGAGMVVVKDLGLAAGQMADGGGKAALELIVVVAVEQVVLAIVLVVQDQLDAGEALRELGLGRRGRRCRGHRRGRPRRARRGRDRPRRASRARRSGPAGRHHRRRACCRRCEHRRVGGQPRRGRPGPPAVPRPPVSPPPADCRSRVRPARPPRGRRRPAARSAPGTRRGRSRRPARSRRPVGDRARPRAAPRLRSRGGCRCPIADRSRGAPGPARCRRRRCACWRYPRRTAPPAGATYRGAAGIARPPARPSASPAARLPASARRGNRRSRSCGRSAALRAGLGWVRRWGRAGRADRPAPRAGPRSRQCRRMPPRAAGARRSVAAPLGLPPRRDRARSLRRPTAGSAAPGARRCRLGFATGRGLPMPVVGGLPTGRPAWRRADPSRARDRPSGRAAARSRRPRRDRAVRVPAPPADRSADHPRVSGRRRGGRRGSAAP